jgi:Flp pilus assembly protein TadD
MLLHALSRTARIATLCAAAFCAVALADDAGEVNRMFRNGQVPEAFAKLEQLLKANPRDPQLRFLKGVMLSDSQRRGEAQAIFEQLSVEYPDLPEPYNNLAVIYAARGEYDKARAALEAALRANPGYAAAHQNLGDVYVQLARQAYSQAQRLEPANPAIAPKLALLRQLTLAPASP